MLLSSVVYASKNCYEKEGRRERRKCEDNEFKELRDRLQFEFESLDPYIKKNKFCEELFERYVYSPLNPIPYGCYHGDNTETCTVIKKERAEFILFPIDV
jgi:hypothetical protein